MNLSTLKVIKEINNNSHDLSDAIIYKTSIYNASCKNEIEISNVILDKMTNTSNYNIIHNHEFISVKDVNQQRIASHENLNFVLLHYHLDISQFKPLNMFLTAVELPNHFLSNVLKIYSNLLNCLQELETSDICYFDLSAENILVDDDCNVILADFKHSLHYSNNSNNFEYLLEKSVENLTQYTFKPIEIHLLHYLTKVNNSPLSYSSIDEITTYYVENMDFLKHFPKEFQRNYYHESVAYLKTLYLHKSKEDILSLMRENWKTWDNFALSVLFLHVFEIANQSFSLNETIISEMIGLIKENLNAVPSKRTTTLDTKTEFDKLFHKNSDWGFLHRIPKNKMKKLYEFL